MAQMGSWKIDDLLTFPCNTHSPTTGAAIDADSVPTYRVYEDETGTAILTGSMAKLDDSNTTGFYSEQLTLSAANGFEKGKCYTIYILATVGGVTGTMHHTLQIEAEVDANVVSDKTGYSLGVAPLDAAGVRSAIGLASASLDTQLVALAGYIDTEVASILSLVGLIKAKTDNLPADTTATLQTIDDLVDELESRLTAIRAGYLDQLNSAMEQDGSVYRFTTNALEQAPAGGGGGGAGSISWDITILVGGNPVDGVDVWITTDLAGSNVIARGDTNDSGVATFLLDVGTYYAWKQLAGYTFTNPESFTVS
jgi:hypothetical protein